MTTTRTTGKLAHIQVKGGMNPGNLGGPVVDVRGNVFGVAQAGIVGTDIKFAIPGEGCRSSSPARGTR